jgi:hypothetical protein
MGASTRTALKVLVRHLARHAAQQCMAASTRADRHNEENIDG